MFRLFFAPQKLYPIRRVVVNHHGSIERIRPRVGVVGEAEGQHELAGSDAQAIRRHVSTRRRTLPQSEFQSVLKI